MKYPQVINLLSDSVLFFDGANIIDNTDQIPIGDPGVAYPSPGYIEVSIQFFRVGTGMALATVIEGAQMKYNELVDVWTISITNSSGNHEIIDVLEDDDKYMGYISEYAGYVGMRPFKISEFAVENEILEKYPFQVVADGTEANSFITWYKEDTFTTPLYRAPVYESGVGTSPASSPERVTHRGQIKTYIVVP